MLEITPQDVAREFPINSQTSVTDRLALLQVRSLLQRTLPSYTYLEIGSFLGGSLTPFLRDPQCTRVLSIDERNRQQPPEGRPARRPQRHGALPARAVLV